MADEFPAGKGLLETVGDLLELADRVDARAKDPVRLACTLLVHAISPLPSHSAGECTSFPETLQ